MKKTGSKLNLRTLSTSLSMKSMTQIERYASELSEKFHKELKADWGLTTLVTVGESWLPSMLEQVGDCAVEKEMHSKVL